jgi:hypothetical protein
MNEILAVLSPALGEELAKDIIAHRKGIKCPLTSRGARALLKQYEATGNAVNAAEHHLNMGWRGFDAAWMKPKANFRDEHNPMPLKTSADRFQSREEYISYHVRKNAPEPEPVNEEMRERLRKAGISA